MTECLLKGWFVYAVRDSIPPIKLQYFNYTFHSVLLYSTPLGHHLCVVPSLNSSNRAASVRFLAGVCSFFVSFSSQFLPHATSHIHPAVCMYSFDIWSSCWGPVFLCSLLLSFCCSWSPHFKLYLVKTITRDL